MSHETIALEVQKRELVGKKLKSLRKKGYIPAVLYGFNVEPTKLQVRTKEFDAAYNSAGRTALLDLSIDEASAVKVFVQEVQRHPLSRLVQHVDFHAVNLTIEITTDVPVILVGEAPAVHNNVGVLLRGLETVTVQALPSDLPQQLEVSIEGLEEVDQTLHVSDLPTDGAYQIITDPSEMIVRITQQQLEPEVEEAPEEEGEGEQAADSDEGDEAE